jgi:uncharacterized membrane protein
MVAIKILIGFVVLACSGVKYLAGIAFAIAMGKFGFWPSVLLTISGGMIGVYLFASLDLKILHFFNRLFRIKPTAYVKFSKKARFLVKLKTGYGLAGIALLTPILLQVPVGTFLAMRLIKNKWKVSLYMLFSFSLYSFAICGAYFFLGEHVRGVLDHFLKH